MHEFRRVTQYCHANLLNPYYVGSSTSNNCPGNLGTCVPCMLGGVSVYTLFSLVGVR